MAIYSTFASVSGEVLEKAFWPAKGEPKAVVQLVHGMAEHIRRYDETAQKLSGAGFAVVGHTPLGHGKNARVLGYFGKENGWDTLVKDTHAVRIATQKEYPNLPYFLLGHSMGSFVVRTYCLSYEKGLSGVILSGTGHFDKAILAAGGLLSKLQCLLGMAGKPSKLLSKISSMGYLKDYADVQTEFDWLSRDREVVKRYIDDPLCGFPFTAKGYGDMFEGLTRLYPEKLGTMEKDVHVYLFSGDKDPVGANGAGVEKVAQEIRDAGVKDVTVKLYPDGRHEMFNELNKEEVWHDLIGWLENQLENEEMKQ